MYRHFKSNAQGVVKRGEIKKLLDSTLTALFQIT